MSSGLPLVSIITPSYNHAPYIRQTIDSVFAQDYLHVEQIVADGGSTDGTVEILKEYAARYPERFRWVSERDRGQSHAFNKGLAMARGEFIGWQNSDDYYLPNVFAEPIHYLLAHPNTSAVFGEVRMLDERTGKLVQQFPGGRFDYGRLLEDNYIPNQALFMRRSVLDACGGLDERLHYAMDYDLYLRLGVDHRVAYLPATRGIWRSTPNVKTVAGLIHALRERVAIVERAIQNPALSPELAARGRVAIQRHIFSALVEELVHGNDARAGDLLHTALRYDPGFSQWPTLYSKLLMQESMIGFWLGKAPNGNASTVPARLVTLLRAEGLARTAYARQTRSVAELALIAGSRPSLRTAIPHILRVAQTDPARLGSVGARLGALRIFQGDRLVTLQSFVAQVRAARAKSRTLR